MSPGMKSSIDKRVSLLSKIAHNAQKSDMSGIFPLQQILSHSFFDQGVLDTDKDLLRWQVDKESVE